RRGAYLFLSLHEQQPSRWQEGQTNLLHQSPARQRTKHESSGKGEMGSFFSTMFTPPPAGGDDPNSAVVAAHSKSTYDEQWEAAKSNGKLMVIDFSASWCGPCRFIEPAFKEMASRYTDVVFVKIDVDELSDVARTWKVEAMPTFVLARGGKEVSRVVGAKKDELERKIGMFRS
ncbi:unnamed protein product, partial [Urochloa humidicola]